MGGGGGNRQLWGLFYKRPGSFLGPKANFEIKTCSKVAHFLAHKPVNLYFHFLIFKIIETLILNANPTNTKQLFMLEKLSGLLSRNGPLVMYDPLYRRAKQWH